MEKITLVLGASPNPELADIAKNEGIEVVDDCMLVMLNKGKF